MTHQKIEQVVDLEAYRKQGFVVLKGWLSKEFESLQKECDRLLNQDWVNPDNGRTPFRFGAKDEPERIDPVVDVSPLFHRLVESEAVLGPVRLCLGEDPLLFKDKLILKAPGVDGYQMHQDWAWGWQDLCKADAVLSFSIQIDGADAENGCIELFPTYHDRLLPPPGLATNFREEEKAMVKAEDGIKVETEPGDVLIFHSLTPHQSGPNRANRSRRSLYLSFNARSSGDLRSDYYGEYRQSSEKFY